MAANAKAVIAISIRVRRLIDYSSRTKQMCILERLSPAVVLRERGSLHRAWRVNASNVKQLDMEAFLILHSRLFHLRTLANIVIDE